MTSPGPHEAATGGVRFFGTRKAYWRLLSRGALLLAITLGIYRFWLATDVRRFLWGNTEVAGESLEYTGTALELLLGFLMAVAIMIPIYAGFFWAALDLGTLGELSGLLGFALLFLVGQYAIYRARRYRLTRTVFRGLRFHQQGSAWVYALRAVLWWTLTVLTIGLAYPFQLASLERYKMRQTFYGDLAGRFAGAGWRLFLRGLPMWLIVMAPIAVAAGAFIEVVDWQALADALSEASDDEMMTRIEISIPGLDELIVFGVLMVVSSVALAALLYPALQAVILRWWSSGLRFGAVEMRSQLRTWRVYGAYLRFALNALLFTLVLAIAGLPALYLVGTLAGDAGETTAAGEIAATAILLAGYVVAVLGYAVIYRATVQLSLWQLGMESLQLSGLTALDRVRAQGRPSSALGEGLADTLHVGGYG